MLKVNESISLFEYQVKIMPGVTFPVNSTLIEITKDELIIISPGDFPNDQLQQFDKKYEKISCIAPNLMHYLHIQAFAEQIPRAKLFGPEGLKKKIPKIASKIQNTNEPNVPLSDKLKIIQTKGNSFVEESLIYHIPTGTLVVTDLIFNMRSPMPIGRSIVLGMVGAFDKVQKSRLIKLTTKDKTSFANSLEDLMGLDIQMIAVAHGEIIKGADNISKALEILRHC